MASEQASQQAFFCVSALLFAASAAVTIVWCASMSAMGEMPMPGGWTMSMAWMRMPGQTWPGAAASFLGMWVVMMVAMMLPSLVPMLWRYRQAVGRTGETRLGRLTALVGVGYFFVWTVFGMAGGTVELVINLHEDTIRIYDSAQPQCCKRFSGAVVSGPYSGCFVIDTREHASIIGAHGPFCSIPWNATTQCDLDSTPLAPAESEVTVGPGSHRELDSASGGSSRSSNRKSGCHPKTVLPSATFPAGS